MRPSAYASARVRPRPGVCTICVRVRVCCVRSRVFCVPVINVQTRPDTLSALSLDASFVQRPSGCTIHVVLVAVDEAHCIDNWSVQCRMCTY